MLSFIKLDFASHFCLRLFLPSAEQTIDMSFPGAGLLVSSCQYTMVPLRGISAPRANGHPFVNGQPYASRAHLNGICTSAGVGYTSTKPCDYSPDEMPQVSPDLGSRAGLS